MSSFLLDKEEMLKRAEHDRDNPYRMHEVCWQVPVDCSAGAFHTRRREAVAKWLEIYQARGWTLAHKDMKQIGPLEAHTEQGLVLPGQNEWRVRAVFRYSGPGLVDKVIELPAALFKHHWLEEDGRLPDLKSDKDVDELVKYVLE